MAGYIGSKAVTLSTTAADVAGNAVIDGDLTVKGTTVTIDSAAVQEIRLGDNDKMTFGDATGGDLQIYHDGSNSRIVEAGTGNLIVQSDANTSITNAAGTTLSGRFRPSTHVSLYYNGSEKLATTSTGIDVTGTVTSNNANGVTLNGQFNAGGDSNARGKLFYDYSAGDFTIENTWANDAGDIFIRAGGSLRQKVSGNGNISFYEDTGTTAKFFWDASAERLGLGTNSPNVQLKLEHANRPSVALKDLSTNDELYMTVENDIAEFNAYTAGTGARVPIVFTQYTDERMRIDSSGNLLVGTTDTQPPTNNDANGIALRADGKVAASRSNGISGDFNNGSTGDIVWLRRAGTTRGILGTGSTSLQVAANAVSGTYNHLQLGASAQNQQTYYLVWDAHNGRFYSAADNTHDVGSPFLRWDDVYATNGTINTSDQNEKQQIASLTDAEITAAKAISKLFKTFKWNDSVAEKGDAARTHTGVIAQQVETAMTDAGLDAGNYAFFISTTWWETKTEVPAVEADEENGVEAQEAYTRTDTYETAEEAPEGATERNRKGIRYPQLLSFIGAATEQRLASIESRLDALEGN